MCGSAYQRSLFSSDSVLLLWNFLTFGPEDCFMGSRALADDYSKYPNLLYINNDNVMM